MKASRAPEFLSNISFNRLCAGNVYKSFISHYMEISVIVCCVSSCSVDDWFIKTSWVCSEEVHVQGPSDMLWIWWRFCPEPPVTCRLSEHQETLAATQRMPDAPWLQEHVNARTSIQMKEREENRKHACQNKTSTSTRWWPQMIRPTQCHVTTRLRVELRVGLKSDLLIDLKTALFMLMFILNHTKIWKGRKKCIRRINSAHRAECPSCRDVNWTSESPPPASAWCLAASPPAFIQITKKIKHITSCDQWTCMKDAMHNSLKCLTELKKNHYAYNKHINEALTLEDCINDADRCTQI